VSKRECYRQPSKIGLSKKRDIGLGGFVLPPASRSGDLWRLMRRRLLYDFSIPPRFDTASTHAGHAGGRQRIPMAGTLGRPAAPGQLVVQAHD
jgi:hypothetical protein